MFPGLPGCVDKHELVTARAAARQGFLHQFDSQLAALLSEKKPVSADQHPYGGQHRPAAAHLRHFISRYPLAVARRGRRHVMPSQRPVEKVACIDAQGLRLVTAFLHDEGWQ